MPRIPIEPDSRLTRPNPQRVEWALYTLKRHYKNAVKMTARFVGASCQCGRIRDVAEADNYINQCFDLSGFSQHPMFMVVPVASDRYGTMEMGPHTPRQWIELAAQLFKGDVHSAACQVGIDPRNRESILLAAMQEGSPGWELAYRHPHPFGGTVARARPPAATFDTDFEALYRRQVEARAAPPPPPQPPQPGAQWVALGNPSTATGGFTLNTSYLGVDVFGQQAAPRPPQPAAPPPPDGEDVSF